ncbi:MAG: DNA translocase FtsK [Myxococcota bacterium]
MGTTATSSLGSFVTSRRRELVLLSLILVALFTLVSMVGFRATDPTLLRPGTGTIDNPCGWVGANLADLAFAAVGHGAWLLVALVGLAVLGIAGRRILGLGQSLALSLLTPVGLALVHLALRPGDPHSPGGAVGWSVASVLESLVGTVGAWLVLVGITVLLVTWAAKIRWSNVASWAVSHLERWAPKLGGWIWSGTRVAGSAVGGVGVAAGATVWSGVRGVGLGTAGLFGRMGASLLRREGQVDDESEDEEWDDDVVSSVWDDSILSDASAVEEESDFRGDTVVGGQRALVEAEWESTVAPAATRGSDEVLRMFPELAPRTGLSSVEQVRRQVQGSFAETPPAPVAAPARVVAPASVAAPAQVVAPAASVAAAAVVPSVISSVAASSSPYDAPEPSAVGRHSVTPEPQPVAPDRVPAPVHAPSHARLGPAAVMPGTQGPGPGVEVHHNELLEERVEDDGRALFQQDAFELPGLGLLDPVPQQTASFDAEELRDMAILLEEKLRSFKVEGKVTGVRPGPVVTIFEFLPDPGIKVSRIAGLSDDLAMALKALRVRIVAPIPGQGVVGIEIPSKRRMTVFLREVLASDAFRNDDAALPCVLGKDVEGRPVTADLAKMPHLLIGGTTGSGKSVGVNGMLMSMLFTKSPDELRLLLVDPKMLEFELYNDIPHLLHPVVTDAKVATQALAWTCREMDERYELLARWGTRNIVSYNKKVERELKGWDRQKAHKYAPKGWSEGDGELPTPEKLPYIVVIVDELADLMMVAGKEVEESICRIAQKARACGIHLIVATQRPSVDVVTGLIKANLPSRIAFQLRSRHDSRTVLDEIGAENLLGKGDMLYMPPGVGSMVRCHGAFVSDEEVARVTDFLKGQCKPEFIGNLEVAAALDESSDAEVDDELYDAAVNLVIQAGKASTSMVQRHLKIGYNRAARLIDAMESAGVIGPADGARPREVFAGRAM